MVLRCYILTTLLLISAKTCCGQVLQFGTCAEVSTMNYFDLERFLGKWYEIERFPTWYEEYGRCAYKTIQACGRLVQIEHGFVRDHIQYVLHVNSTYTPGDDAIFTINESNVDPFGIPLSVIHTDYNNYAIVYGCKNNENDDLKYISAWILSRTQLLSPEIRSEAYQLLNNIPYANPAYLEQVDQSEQGCNYQWTAHVNAENNDEDTDE